MAFQWVVCILQYSVGDQLEWHRDEQLLVMESLSSGADSRGKYTKRGVSNMDRVHQLIFRRVHSGGSYREILEKEKVREKS